MDSTDAPSTSALAEVQSAIAGDFAKLLSDASGRGPEQINCYVHPDFVLLVMHGVMSRAEHTLSRTDNPGLAGSTRLAFHETLRPRLRELVERHTGRAVQSALPQFDQTADVLVEVLLLSDAGE